MLRGCKEGALASPAAISLPVYKKTSVRGRGEKKPHTAAAAGMAVLPEKVGQAVLQSPVRRQSPQHSEAPTSPQIPPRLLRSQLGAACPTPKAAAAGLRWHQSLTLVSGQLFASALWSHCGGSGSGWQRGAPCKRRSRAGGRAEL